MSVCMRPHRRGECSGASYWPVGCVSVNYLGVFEYVGTMLDEQVVGVLAEAFVSMREGGIVCLAAANAPLVQECIYP